jgi:hypothetical protein
MEHVETGKAGADNNGIGVDGGFGLCSHDINLLFLSA